MINTITECEKCVGKGLCVVFLWTAAHMGVLGTERADRIAKEAVKRSAVQRSINVRRQEYCVEKKQMSSGNRIGK